jgi:hypothetical protein
VLIDESSILLPLGEGCGEGLSATATTTLLRASARIRLGILASIKLANLRESVFICG